MYTIGEFAKKLGVSVKTLQRWDTSGKLVAKRHPSGRRYYDSSHIPYATNGEVVGYCRVSSASQRDDLERQVEFVMNSGYSFDRIVEEIGGGMNLKRPKFRMLISDIIEGKVSILILAHKDRAMRFGFDLLEYICDLKGTKVIILESATMSPQEELVNDILSIIHTFSSRLYGLRKYKKKIEDDIRSQD